MKLHHAEFTLFTIEPRTQWVFAEIYDHQGNSTLTELTSPYDPKHIVQSMKQALDYLSSHHLTEANIETLLGYTTAQLNNDLLNATIVSAIKTSVTQLEAKLKKLRIDHFLGSNSENKQVPLYANINRATFNTNRTHSDFVTYAIRAVDSGFKTIKLAPFDELNHPASLQDSVHGLQTIEEVRNAVGEEIEILIDCHSKFDYSTAIKIADKLAKYNISWFEESVEPDPYSFEFSQLSKIIEIPVAGGELIYGKTLFESLCKQGYDVLMPDIKYCGGILEAVEISRIVASYGKTTSIHSPSGPVSLLSSGYTTLALINPGILEHAVYESPWRHDILDPPETIVEGQMLLPPGIGFGAKLNKKTVSKYGISLQV